MSRLRERLSNPISDEERPRLFALVAATLVAVAGMLTVIAPAGDLPPANTTRPPAAAAVVAPQPAPVAGPPAAVTDAARAFVDDYLTFVAGRADDPPTFAHASRRLARRLAGYRLRISPATRQRRPRVLRLDTRRVADESRWVVTATIADGGVATYPIELVIAIGGDRRPVVTGLGEE